MSRSLQNVLFTLTSPTKSSENTLLSSQLPSSNWLSIGWGCLGLWGPRFPPQKVRPPTLTAHGTKVGLLELVPVLPKDVVVTRRRAAGIL